MSSVSSQADGKQDVLHLECVEEDGFETLWVFFGPGTVQVILAGIQARQQYRLACGSSMCNLQHDQGN